MNNAAGITIQKKTEIYAMTEQIYGRKGLFKDCKKTAGEEQGNREQKNKRHE